MRHHPLDDATIETFFASHEPGEALAPLAGFVDDLHGMTSGPAPAPSVQLAAMLADGFATAGAGPVMAAAGSLTEPAAPPAGSSWTRKRTIRIAEVFAGFGVAAKVALGAGAAAAAVTAGGAAGVLPGPAQHAVSTGIEALTPFSFPDQASDKADFGRRVSTDAHHGGVDGATVGSEAKLNGDVNRPADAGPPAAPGQNGLDRANQTPAAGHAPTVVPAGKPAPAGTPAPAGAPAPAGTPGSAGLGTAATTPASGQVPSSVPARDPAPTPTAGAGTQSTNGLGTAASTPASARVPASVPPARGRP